MIQFLADNIRIAFYASFTGEYQTFQSTYHLLFHIPAHHFFVLDAFLSLYLSFLKRFCMMEGSVGSMVGSFRLLTICIVPCLYFWK